MYAVRRNDDESYEVWCKRVEMYEHGWAMQRIAEGVPVDQVLEKMSYRLLQKLMNPIYEQIRNTTHVEYDIEASKKEYAEKYLNNQQPVADHVEGDIFDNRK